jgi:glyoxylase-like metal-dependent hydrolase (beta-lactamase superfamily II)
MSLEKLQVSSLRPAAFLTPALGVPTEVAPGILLLKLPLPTRLNHVNTYLLEDDDGWTVIDTGMQHEGCVSAWSNVFRGVLFGKRVARLLITHFHIDHVGLAGWFDQTFAPTLYMSQSEYLLSRVFESQDWETGLSYQTAFFQQCGLSAERAEVVSRGRLSYQAYRTPLPCFFHRIRAGDTICIGGRDWRILTGAGHSIEQVMLYDSASNIFLAADQVLPEITPNISVGPMLPNADPLGDYLQFLHEVTDQVADNVLVLPGHRTPFHGLHERVRALQHHHEMRCAAVLAACRDSALTSFDLVPAIFGRTFANDVIGHAVGEAIAHANYLRTCGKLISKTRSDGKIVYVTS